MIASSPLKIKLYTNENNYALILLFILVQLTICPKYGRLMVWEVASPGKHIANSI